MSSKKEKLTEAQSVAKMLNSSLKTKAFHGDPALLLSNVTRWLPTGATLVDEATTGGVPQGRVIELYGPPDVGKSTLGQAIIKRAIDLDWLPFYIDKENALDRKRAVNIGLDMSKIVFMVPSTIEEVFTLICGSVEKVRVGKITKPIIFVWDTLARTMTDEQKQGKRKLGSLARAVRSSIAELGDTLPEGHASLLILNHRVAKNISSGRSSYGSPGGSALYHEASLRLRMAYTAEGKIKDGDRIVGNIVNLKVEESNLCAPYREAPVFIRFKEGLDDFGANVFFMKKINAFEQNGTWFVWKHKDKEYKFQNDQQFLKQMGEDTKLMDAFREEVRGRYRDMYA